MATIKDVAARVGVSITTVSRVLNNRGSISEKTRKKVYEAMKELDYYPDEIARSLLTKHSYMIGLIVPSIDHPFFAKLTDSIEKSCYEAGFKLLVCTSDNRSDKEKEMFSMLRAHKVAGVLLCSRLEDASVYADSKLPLVSIERTIENVPSISCDNYKGGVIAAQELMNCGCRHPVLFGNNTFPYLPANLRYQGFYDECVRQKIKYTKYMIDAEDLFVKDFRKNISELFALYPETDGIFATGDILAARIVSEYQAAGKKIPQDLQVVGFDGIDVSDYCGITTVAQPIRQMGELAVDILLKRISGKIVPEQSILPVSFVKRRSTRQISK